MANLVGMAKRVRVTSDGTTGNTHVHVEGVELTRVKAFRIEADAAAGGLVEVHLVLELLPHEFELDLDGDVQLSAAAAEQG